MPEKSYNNRIAALAKKWREGNITAAERIEFESWYNSFDDTQLELDSSESINSLRERLYQAILERENITPQKVKTLIPWARVAAAASVLLLLSVGGLFVFHKEKTPQYTNDVAPGSNKAILTLASGKKIILTDIKNGKIAEENNAAILKTADGKVVYNLQKNAGSLAMQGAIAYNTIATPRGGQYWVILNDGSKVLLNAASSLKYPTNFTEKLRKVELTGEAYFEVAKDKQHPFVVVTNQQQVEVLGTHFNINSYSDESSVKTTLLEGSVKVSDHNNHAGILKPGEQAVLSANSFAISEANTEEALAWKNGYFMFGGEDITSVMRKVSRWYNVDVVFDGPMPTDKFEGTVNRFDKVSHVLAKLELTNKVHFTIDGRRIIVSK